MNKLQKDETELVGNWVKGARGVEADETERRIEWLTDEVLQKVADSPKDGAWETVYRDPADGRLWERTYHKGYMHGGGPRTLTNITAEDARAKYGVTNIP